VKRNTRPLEHPSCKQSKNKQEQVEQAIQMQMEIKTNLNSKKWGSELSRTDGLADTCVYMEVAMANTFNKKTHLFVVAMEVFER
jgi:hypothetical protein